MRSSLQCFFFDSSKLSECIYTKGEQIWMMAMQCFAPYIMRQKLCAIISQYMLLEECKKKTLQKTKKVLTSWITCGLNDEMSAISYIFGNFSYNASTAFTAWNRREIYAAWVKRKWPQISFLKIKMAHRYLTEFTHSLFSGICGSQTKVAFSVLMA